MMDLKGKKALVVGLGASGISSTELLLKKGAFVKISDSSEKKQIKSKLDQISHLPVEVEVGGHTSSFCSGADIVVISPGINLMELYHGQIIERNQTVIGELELGYQFCRGRIIAITGTNGKSTVTELIGKLLTSAGIPNVVCGNIGNPLSGEVGRIDENGVAVVEVSSFQLETIRDFCPDIAVLLNISEDHYDRHGDLKKYTKEKFKIFSNQNENNWAVINSSLKNEESIKGIKSRVQFYGADSECAEVDDTGIFFNLKATGKFRIDSGEIPLKGRHNVENTAAAVMSALIMGGDKDVVINSLKSFNGLGHRFESIGSYEGIEFINDSKATNVDATRRALSSLDKKVVLIAGGKDKGGDYLSTEEDVRRSVSCMVLIGEASGKISRAYRDIVPVVFAENMKDAVLKAVSKASSGEAVMLSPMCSSFDMYSSYKERGQDFVNEVKAAFTKEKEDARI